MRLFSRSLSDQSTFREALVALATRLGNTPWDYRVTPRMQGIRWAHEDHYDTLLHLSPRRLSLRDQAAAFADLVREAPYHGVCPHRSHRSPYSLHSPGFWWLSPLGLTALPNSQADLTQAYRRRARHVHPDAGGDPVAFRTLTEARDAGKAWLRAQ